MMTALLVLETLNLSLMIVLSVAGVIVMVRNHRGKR